jgi:hypothetical protein
MRFAIATIVAIGLAAAPAAAQETTEANTAVVAEPEAATANADQPVLPVTDDTNMAAPVPPVVEPPLEPEPITTDRDRSRLPWGLLGLIGLVGLLGRVRT